MFDPSCFDLFPWPRSGVFLQRWPRTRACAYLPRRKSAVRTRHRSVLRVRRSSPTVQVRGAGLIQNAQLAGGKPVSGKISLSQRGLVVSQVESWGPERAFGDNGDEYPLAIRKVKGKIRLIAAARFRSIFDYAEHYFGGQKSGHMLPEPRASHV